MLNIGLIGAGAHSVAYHAPALARLAREHAGEITLMAVCDLDKDCAETACAKFGFQHSCRTVAALEKLPLDAALIIVPATAILTVMRQLLPRKIPLLIEKPIGVTVRGARELVAAASASRVPIMVSMNRRFDPGVRLAAAWRQEQGPLRSICGSMLRTKRTEPEFVWSTGIHLVDLLWSLAGPLVLAENAARRVPIVGGSGVSACLTGAGGAVVMVELVPCAGRVQECLQLIGDEYCINCCTGSVHPWRVELYKADRLERMEAMPPDQPEYIRNGTYDETAAFVNALRAQCPLPAPSPADVLPGVELADRLHQVAVGSGFS
ncbi:MAG: Gfo/Idh/MocA family oxidoreductase [Verrucomicrobia bacterium]|nr:Gfo/Idh/MocA family oxidoreductase [Verrucomicrobiota bacterium]MBU1735560.1 Gfo/Idh/MocA family oxidoreductase [Verrucomicrobiota bacterium]MBU1856543.1 Gfo/Idh/MocA family oxidoreductase [Verrucomicrobiota bacterium]